MSYHDGNNIIDEWDSYQKANKKFNELDLCIHTGKTTKHYTKYEPNCKDCIGYDEKCKEENKYKPRRDLLNKLARRSK